MLPEAHEPTSLSLLERARGNDQDAWRQLVRLYAPLVQIWCKRTGLQDGDTADVFQETFLAVNRELGGFRPTRSIGSFRCWLRTVVRTKIADHFRRLKRQPPGHGGSTAQLQMGNVPEFVDLESDDESEEAMVVQRALELIKPEFTEQNWSAFLQVAIEGKNAVEVAEQLGVNAQTVRQANYRIRRRLRAILNGLVEPAED